MGDKPPRMWTSDPGVLLRDEWWKFMYTRGSSPESNANSFARFIILWTILAVVVTGRPSVIIVGAVLLTFSSSLVPQTAAGGSAGSTAAAAPGSNVGVFFDSTGNTPLYRYCQLPSAANPSANLMSYHIGHGTKLPACPSDMVTDLMNEAIDTTTLVDGGKLPGEDVDPTSTHMRRQAAYSMPSTTVTPDREALIHATMGGNIRRSSDMSQWTEVDMWRHPRYLLDQNDEGIGGVMM